MPALVNPKDSEERDLWMKACVAQPGEVVDGLSKAQKSKIRSRFYVVGGKLMDRILRDEKGIERPVFIDSDFNALCVSLCLNSTTTTISLCFSAFDIAVLLKRPICHLSLMDTA